MSLVGRFLAQKFIILYFNHSGIVEGSIFATEDVAERIADKVGIANHQVSAMMRMTVDPCGNSTASNVVADFGGVGSIQYTSLVPIFDSCE